MNKNFLRKSAVLALLAMLHLSFAPKAQASDAANDRLQLALAGGALALGIFTVYRVEKGVERVNKTANANAKETNRKIGGLDAKLKNLREALNKSGTTQPEPESQEVDVARNESSATATPEDSQSGPMRSVMVENTTGKDVYLTNKVPEKGTGVTYEWQIPSHPIAQTIDVGRNIPNEHLVPIDSQFRASFDPASNRIIVTSPDR
jgi:hypothetical protein